MLERLSYRLASLARKHRIFDPWTKNSPARGAIAGLFASLPLVATLRFLAYIDIRTRREGWDIQVRFLELGRVLEAGST